MPHSSRVTAFYGYLITYEDFYLNRTSENLTRYSQLRDNLFSGLEPSKAQILGEFVEQLVKEFHLNKILDDKPRFSQRTVSDPSKLKLSQLIELIKIPPRRNYTPFFFFIVVSMLLAAASFTSFALLASVGAVAFVLLGLGAVTGGAMLAAFTWLIADKWALRNAKKAHVRKLHELDLDKIKVVFDSRLVHPKFRRSVCLHRLIFWNAAWLF